MKIASKFGVFGALGVVALMGAGSAFGAIGATITIQTTVGNGLQLLANTPNQQITVSVSSVATQIQGEDLNVAINSGTAGPKLVSGDFLTGTIFAASNTFTGTGTQQSAFIATPETGAGIPVADQNFLIIEHTTTVGAATANPNGLLATLTVDTTGFAAGSTFSLNLLSGPNGTSVLSLVGGSSLPLQYATSGNVISLIAATPEPASAGLLTVGGIFLMKRRRREA